MMRRPKLIKYTIFLFCFCFQVTAESEFQSKYNEVLFMLVDGNQDSAVRIIEEEISKGDTRAMLFFSSLLMKGSYGLSIDVKRAMSLIEKAVKLKDPEALTVRASILLEGNAYLRKDIKKGLKILKNNANNGSILANYILGNYYFYKDSESQDESLYHAIQYVNSAKRLIKSNNSTELKKEIELLSSNLNSRLNYELFMNNTRVLEKLADEEIVDYQIMLANYFESSGRKSDEKKAFALFQKLAEQMNPHGLFKLGEAYEYGKIGFEIDEKIALEYYEKSGEYEAHEAIERLQKKRCMQEEQVELFGIKLVCENDLSIYKDKFSVVKKEFYFATNTEIGFESAELLPWAASYEVLISRNGFAKISIKSNSEKVKNIPQLKMILKDQFPGVLFRNNSDLSGVLGDNKEVSIELVETPHQYMVVIKFNVVPDKY